jgi:hypothetical protein
VVEKDVIGYQFYYGDYSPSRDLFEPIGKPFHVWNAGGRKPQCVDSLKKRSAGTIGQNFLLALEQAVPAVVLLGRVGIPLLVDGPVGIARGIQVAVFVRINDGRCRTHGIFSLTIGESKKYSKSTEKGVHYCDNYGINWQKQS